MPISKRKQKLIRSTYTLNKGKGYTPSDVDAAAFISGYAPNTPVSYKKAVNTLIVDLKASGCWAAMDWLVIPTDTASGSVRNVRNRAKAASAIGGPIFTAYRGWAGDAASSYLTINEIWQASGNLFALNSAHVGVYVNAQNSGYSGFRAEIGNLQNNARLQITANNTSDWSVRANDSTDTAAGNPGTRLGYMLAVRPDATTKKAWLNGTKTVDTALASTTLNITNGTILRSNTTQFSDDRIGLFHSGGALTDTQAANASTIIHTFMTAIGAQY